MLHSINVDKDNQVFVSFSDNDTMVSVFISPEDAIKIGEIGQMASTCALADKFQKEYDDELFEKSISDMKVGESGYAVPWALSFDAQKRPYLRLDFSVDSSPGGTVQMLVQRLEKDYWQVRIPKGYKYSKPSNPNAAWNMAYNLNVI